jgi:hypothetical protein
MQSQSELINSRCGHLTCLRASRCGRHWREPEFVLPRNGARLVPSDAFEMGHWNAQLVEYAHHTLGFLSLPRAEKPQIGGLRTAIHSLDSRNLMPLF